MKLLWIIYDSAIDDTLRELFDRLELPGYTRVERLFGAGGRGRKRDDAVFPGSNNLVMTLVPDEDVERIRRAIRRLQAEYRIRPGVTIICQDAEELP